MHTRPLKYPLLTSSIYEILAMGNCFVAVLKTLMKRRIILFNSLQQPTEAKYESAHTIQLLLVHGYTNVLRTCVPCSNPSSPEFSCSVLRSSSVFTSLRRNTTPLLPQSDFCISQPFSGFWSMTIYTGSPILIQWPSFPYHIDILLSAHMKYDGTNVKYLLSWNAWTKPSTDSHLYFSCNMSSIRSAGWSPNQMYAPILSNWFLVLTVFPKYGAGKYFDGATLDHNVLLDPKSNSVVRIRTPDFFSISPIVVWVFWHLIYDDWLASWFFEYDRLETTLKINQDERIYNWCLILLLTNLR